MKNKKSEQNKIDWNLVGFVISSDYRFNVLRLLENQILTPTQLKNELNIGMTHISNELKSLRNKNLVECINPEMKKGRLYRISKLGLKIFEIVLEIKEMKAMK